MARKLRIEYEGALYHVINRGNYRNAVFGTKGARTAFLKCLGEACVKSKWVVHAYILMSNHYHLAIETPRGNLVEGMRWLQSTFANRFNRLRGENGHVFQGRYKALLVEDQAGLGALCHYIHLNPVRARLLPIERLEQYEQSSYWMLLNPKQRPAWLRAQTCLEVAGTWTDSAAGRGRYVDFLKWLAENEPAQKELKFETMVKGWALGGSAFKRALIEDHNKVLAGAPAEGATKEAREFSWHRALQAALRALSKSAADVKKDRKGAEWKVAIATHFRSVSQATNVWLAEHLNMGAPAGVSRYVSEFRDRTQGSHNSFRKLSKITV